MAAICNCRRVAAQGPRVNYHPCLLPCEQVGRKSKNGGPKPVPMSRVHILIGFFLLSLLPARADGTVDPEKLNSLRQKWIQAKAKSTQPLRDKYLKALTALRKKLTQGGKLEEAILVRDEIELLKKGELTELSDGGGIPSQLILQRQAYDRGIAQVTKELERKYITALQKLRKSFGESDQLEAAVAVTNELDKIAKLIRERDFKPIAGKFHFYVDDTAKVYLNGKQFHSHRVDGYSSSGKMEIRVGDCVFLSAVDGGGPKYIHLAFLSDDGKKVVSFRSKDMRLLPDQTEERALSEEDFKALKEKPKKGFNTLRRKFDFKNKSDWMWGEGRFTVLVCIITEEMISELRR